VASNDAFAELIKWFIFNKLILKIYETNFMRFSTNNETFITLLVGCDLNTASKAVM
jgi:transaldolase